jgi:WD40 repeat protein
MLDMIKSSLHRKLKIFIYMLVFFGHAGWIQAISFRDDDGSILASVDDDTVYVWNIIHSLCLYRLSVSSIFFFLYI